MTPPFDLPQVDALIRAALAEDIGRGDLTTEATVPPELEARAEIVAKQNGILAGLPLLSRVFAALGAPVQIDAERHDGDRIAAGDIVARLTGRAGDLLTGERTALNLLQHLSGVATQARRYAEAVRGTRARVVDTRKTHPGMRALEKYAVRVGGAQNHRAGLDDGVLIKDNHIAAAGGIETAVRRARERVPHTIRIEVECATLDQVDQAIAAGVDAVLLDNMSAETMRQAVERIAGRAVTEASGNVTLENIRAVADTGIDLISVGALTHSAPIVDLSMKIR